MKGKHRIPSKLLISALCLFVWAVPAQGGSDEGLFWVQEYVAVSGDVITFEDIATPRNDRAEEHWQSIKDTQLWQSPSSGQRIVIERSQIMNRLRETIGEIAQAAVIPSEVIFQSGRSVLDEENLQDMVKDHLRPKLSSKGERIEFRDFRLPDPIFLERAYEEVEIESVNDVQPGRNTLRFVVRDGHGELVRRHTGNVFVDVWVTVACADRPLNRGDVVDPGDVRFEEKNLAYLRHEVWDGESGPWRMTSTVGKGRPILKRYLEPVPMVSEGSEVDLTYDSEYINLVVPARALEDGQRGDRIRVRNMETDKEVRATIESGSRVTAR